MSAKGLWNSDPEQYKIIEPFLYKALFIFVRVLTPSPTDNGIKKHLNTTFFFQNNNITNIII
jgi:hypothetical protein